MVKRAPTRIVVSVCLTAVGVPVAAQVVRSDGPKPQFEIASVRPNKSGASGASLRVQAGGGRTGTNQTAQNLIRNAFNIQFYHRSAERRQRAARYSPFTSRRLQAPV